MRPVLTYECAINEGDGETVSGWGATKTQRAAFASSQFFGRCPHMRTDSTFRGYVWVLLNMD